MRGVSPFTNAAQRGATCAFLGKRVRSLGNELVPSPAFFSKPQGGIVGVKKTFFRIARRGRHAKQIEPYFIKEIVQ